MPAAPLSIRDYAAYLVGNRQAILRIATSKGALAIGALFVLSAGLAREYDGADLRAEPWHLLIPFGASLITSLLLFNEVRHRGRKDRIEPMPFWRSYRGFLSLYWATAPLAWLYAIPVERFLSLMGAIRANYIILLVVSIWRVALITRVLAVTNSCRYWLVFPIVLYVSAVVAIFAGSAIPVPFLAMMGGIRPPDDELLVMEIGNQTICGAALVAPFAYVFAGLIRDRLRYFSFPRDIPKPNRIGRPLAAFAVLSVMAWVPLMVGPQIEQRNRHLVEQATKDKHFDEAVRILTVNPRADFPPHWRPPPWHVFGSANQLDAIFLLDECVRRGAPVWVVETYHQVVMRQYLYPGYSDLTNAHYEALLDLAAHDDEILWHLENPRFFPEATQPEDPLLRRKAILQDLYDRARIPDANRQEP